MPVGYRGFILRSDVVNDVWRCYVELGDDMLTETDGKTHIAAVQSAMRWIDAKNKGANAGPDIGPMGDD